MDYNKLKMAAVKDVECYFEQNGPTNVAIIGISGGKDSSVVAALCVEALGADRVVGILMPDGVQLDMEYSLELVDFLGIDYTIVNINPIKKAFEESGNLAHKRAIQANSQIQTNLPARIRMATLYNYAALYGGRVINTSNLSERLIGYSTKWGDSVGDYAPLLDLYVSEVIGLGRELGLPEKFLVKPPADGMTGKTDEEQLGFSYQDVEDLFEGRANNIKEEETIIEIHRRHSLSSHKRDRIPFFKNEYR